MIDPAKNLPRRFGHYLLLERLGAGGMAEVFIARHLARFDRLCALKKMLPANREDEDFAVRFADEARLVMAMEHPNVVRVLEAGWAHGERFVAMELVEGLDVGKLLARASHRRRALPIPGAVFIACEVLRGLEYCHRRTDAAGVPLRVVHRDIAPGNVIVSFEGDVKIADFGLAVFALRAARTRPDILMGKPGYLAPERLAGGPVDHRADLFNVGILLFELLTGQRFAFSCDPERLEAEVQMRAVTGIRRARSAVSLELEHIVGRALSPDRRRRYASAAEFRQALERVCGCAEERFGRPQLAKMIADVFNVASLRARLAALLRDSLPRARKRVSRPAGRARFSTMIERAPTDPLFGAATFEAGSGEITGRMASGSGATGAVGGQT